MDVIVAKELKLVLREALEERFQAHGEVVLVRRDELFLHAVEAAQKAVLDRLHQRNRLATQQRMALHSIYE